MRSAYLALVLIQHSSPRAASTLGSILSFLNQGIFSSLISTAILAAVGLWYTRNKKRIKERARARDPHAIHPWNLIGEHKDDAGHAIELLEAINRGAVEHGQRNSGNATEKTRVRFAAFRKVKPSIAKARSIWNPVDKELFAAANHFVSPEAAITEGGPARRGKAIEAAERWLEQCHERETPPATGRISVRSAGGAGKSVFMHRLLLDLAVSGGSRRTPVPMLASAATVQRNAERITHLQTTEDSLSAFVEVWLENRGFNLHLDAKETLINKESLINDFKHALTGGEIVLLLDGDDELRQQGLERFTLNLLHEVRYWVVAHRPGPELIKTERRISFDDSWDQSSINDYIDLRAAQPTVRNSALVAKRDFVKSVIDEVLRRYAESAKREGAAQNLDSASTAARLAQPQPHWLSQPSNLDRFLAAIESGELKDETDIRRSAESPPYLFGKMVAAAVDKINATNDLDAIRDRLCEIAVNDPTNTRRQPTGTPQNINDNISLHLRKLTELVGFSDKQARFYFKHAALRSYFIAGQIARELLDPFHALEPSDELARKDVWSAARRESVQSWLHETSTEPTASIAVRLRRGATHDRRLDPIMLRNLLDLLVDLRLAAGTPRTGIEPLSDLDLSGIPGNRLDLHLMKLNRCDFTNASLVDAELTSTTFNDCAFNGADLSGADAVSAAFNDCSFGADGVDPAQVRSMAIDRAEFTLQGTPARLQRELLIQRGASLERSRYRGEFGKRFFAAQKAFLGSGVERLERDHYLRAIEEAVAGWMKKDSSSPIYLVDLMAGGSYDRIAELRKKFDHLHILGIDRDPSATPLDSRFQWAQFEIGKDSTRDEVALGFDISSSLRKYFGAGAALAHIIVAKKAFHEIDRNRQQLLIHECARALRPGGRLILFEDTPGIVDGDVAPDLPRTLAELDTLRHTLGEDVDDVQRDVACEPDDVVRALAPLDFDTSAAKLIGFANTWIMVKDWANLNRHEVRNRYFASVPEIKEWAKGVFGVPRETKSDHYRLNPLIFNELGIQRVLDHLAREGGNGAQVVDRDEANLSEWIWENERLRVLVDFTKKYFAPGAPLTKALDAKEESIDLTQIDPALALLNRSDITAPTFNLPCTVLVFEKS